MAQYRFAIIGYTDSNFVVASVLLRTDCPSEETRNGIDVGVKWRAAFKPINQRIRRQVGIGRIGTKRQSTASRNRFVCNRREHGSRVDFVHHNRESATVAECRDPIVRRSNGDLTVLGALHFRRSPGKHPRCRFDACPGRRARIEAKGERLAYIGIRCYGCKRKQITFVDRLVGDRRHGGRLVGDGGRNDELRDKGVGITGTNKIKCCGSGIEVRRYLKSARRVELVRAHNRYATTVVFSRAPHSPGPFQLSCRIHLQDEDVRAAGTGDREALPTYVKLCRAGESAGRVGIALAVDIHGVRIIVRTTLDLPDPTKVAR